MTTRQQIVWLPGGRLHLQDGPIDLIVGADGPPPAVRRAFEAAAGRFADILDELCAELAALRMQAGPVAWPFEGPIARRMAAAIAPFADAAFITPMAAVAGAVAEAILAAMTAAAPLTRAYVNNGGDIALHLSPGEHFRIGLVDRPDHPSLFGRLSLDAADPVRGIATSGWRGRSFSLGIADAVTVLAATAAMADAAATIVANAVDLPDHPGIVRRPARDLRPDSDLGDRRVTRAVPPLAPDAIARALEAGAVRAQTLVDSGLIVGVALHLQGATRTLGSRSLGGLRLLPVGEKVRDSGDEGVGDSPHPAFGHLLPQAGKGPLRPQSISSERVSVHA